MNIVNGHAHAHYGYGAVTVKDFFNLIKNVVETKCKGYLSLNAHLILGVKNINQARARIKKILAERGGQIKHLHLHENDLLYDLHNSVGKVIDKKLLEILIKGRSYIYEKGVAQEDW